MMERRDPPDLCVEDEELAVVCVCVRRRARSPLRVVLASVRCRLLADSRRRCGLADPSGSDSISLSDTFRSKKHASFVGRTSKFD